MQEHFQPPLSEIFVGVVCTGFAMVCGWLKYLTEVQAGEPFSWGSFLLKGLTSAAFGAMVWGLSSVYALPGEAVGAVCGLCGWLGTGVVALAKAVVMKRLGLTKEDIEEK